MAFKSLQIVCHTGEPSEAELKWDHESGVRMLGGWAGRGDGCQKIFGEFLDRSGDFYIKLVAECSFRKLELLI